MTDKPWIVKAFHTGGPYTTDAKKLRDSAEKFGVPIDIEVIKSRGSWNSNTHYKPRSILRAMKDHPDKKIIHIDVDAWFMQYPALFDDFDYDLGAFYWGNGGTWCSGTLLIRNSEAVVIFLKRWVAALRGNPKQHGDQVALGRLLDGNHGLNIGRIPPGYLQGLSSRVAPGEGVIAHDGARKRYVQNRIFSDPK